MYLSVASLCLVLSTDLMHRPDVFCWGAAALTMCYYDKLTCTLDVPRYVFFPFQLVVIPHCTHTAGCVLFALAFFILLFLHDFAICASHLRYPWFHVDAAALRVHSGPSTEPISFHSSIWMCFHQLHDGCVVILSQLWQSGALRQRYTELLFLLEPQRSNSAQNTLRMAGNQMQIQNKVFGYTPC